MRLTVGVNEGLFIKLQGISCLAEELLVSAEGHCSIGDSLLVMLLVRVAEGIVK